MKTGISKEKENPQGYRKSSEDYRCYELDAGEKKNYYGYALVVSLLIGMLFYDSLWAALIIFCLAPYFEDSYSAYLCGRRKDRILTEFKDALYTLASSISAGRQLPRAIEDAASSSQLLFGDESVMAAELRNISKGYRTSNGSIELLLKDLAERTGIDEIDLFAESCSICRQSGGDMEAVCLKSAYMLIEKIDYAKETEAVLAEKKMDTVILLILPPSVLLFLKLFSGNYVSVLYASLQGRLLMTGALGMMALSVLWSLKLMRLEL